MSPAKKRKTAPRAASRGGKAAATERKTARGVAAGARRASGPLPRGRSAPAGARSRSAERCTLSPRRLAGLLDGADRAELLAHVPSCGACSTTLTVLAAESQGLQRLTHESAGGTAVERILARGVRQGDRKLADLVYEMTKACLVVVQDIDRRLHLATRPREAAVIDRDVRGVAARLPMRLREAASALPRGKPEEDQALSAAESCVRILERVEGASERQRLAKSVWLICAGRANEAEGVLRGMLGGNIARTFRRSVLHNLAWTLSRQRQFDSALSVCQLALREFPDDWMTVYNASVSASLNGSAALARRYASVLKRVPAEGGAAEQRRRAQHLAFEVPRIAERLGLSESTVARWFGVQDLEEAVGSRDAH